MTQLLLLLLLCKVYSKVFYTRLYTDEGFDMTRAWQFSWSRLVSLTDQAVARELPCMGRFGPSICGECSLTVPLQPAGTCRVLYVCAATHWLA